jgi:hypothetical protein
MKREAVASVATCCIVALAAAMLATVALRGAVHEAFHACVEAKE